MVYRLLVTGAYKQVLEFHLPLALRLNWIRARGNTYLYTFWADGNDGLTRLVERAKRADVTVQQIEHGGDAEEYVMLHLASHGMQWTPPKPKPEKAPRPKKPRKRRPRRMGPLFELST